MCSGKKSSRIVRPIHTADKTKQAPVTNRTANCVRCLNSSVASFALNMASC